MFFLWQFGNLNFVRLVMSCSNMASCWKFIVKDPLCDPSIEMACQCMWSFFIRGYGITWIVGLYLLCVDFFFLVQTIFNVPLHFWKNLFINNRYGKPLSRSGSHKICLIIRQAILLRKKKKKKEKKNQGIQPFSLWDHLCKHPS